LLFIHTTNTFYPQIQIENIENRKVFVFLTFFSQVSLVRVGFK